MVGASCLATCAAFSGEGNLLAAFFSIASLEI
jgi:hypothetical protein